MIFSPDTLRYCLLCYNTNEATDFNTHGNKPIPISGLYNWARVLGGVRAFPRSRDELASFNVVHMNLTAFNISVLDRILQMLDRSTTKLLLNVDYAVELWNGNFPAPQTFLRAVDKADFIFAVEPLMASILGRLLRRPVPVIPHPVDVESLSSLSSTTRDKRIGFSIHGYDTNSVLAFLAAEMAVPHDEWVFSAFGKFNNTPYMNLCFDEFVINLDFERFVKYLSHMFAVIESYSIHSYGRTTVECAALGVPSVGPDCVYAQQVCFPSISHPFNDLPAYADSLSALISDPAFYTSVVSHAKRQAQLFSFTASREKMLTFLNSGG